MLQDPAAFSTACSALLAFQQSALTAQAGGEHLVFLADGDTGDTDHGDIESNMMMAVSRFLQKHTKFISVLEGGYSSFHQESPRTTATNVSNSSDSNIEPSPNKLTSIKTSLKQKSANIKDSLINYIYNPGSSEHKPEPKHIDFTKRGSKLYKNTGDVFCLDDEDDDNVTDVKDIEEQADTVHFAQCQRVDETGLLTQCHLLVTKTHLNVLLPGPRPGSVIPSSSRHLSSIVKITSKKRQPEIITFKVNNIVSCHIVVTILFSVWNKSRR